MKISTKGRYALRLMLELAMAAPGEHMSIKQIAKRQDLSEKYLEQIITLLNRAGFVTSIRGPQGGYRLAKKPSEYTVGMILRLTEGSLTPVACMDDDPNQCPRQNCCGTLPFWKKLAAAIDEVVEGTTLADLAEEQKRRTTELDYSI